MSRIHDAMCNLEHQSEPETGPAAGIGSLVGALIEQLADEVPDDPHLGTVKTDLQAASRSCENDKKKDLALRFYLAMRSLLREHELLQARLQKMEKNRASDGGDVEQVHLAVQDQQKRDD